MIAQSARTKVYPIAFKCRITVWNIMFVYRGRNEDTSSSPRSLYVRLVPHPLRDYPNVADTQMHFDVMKNIIYFGHGIFSCLLY